MKTNVSRMIVLGLIPLAPLGSGTRLTAQAAGPEVEGQWGLVLDWGEMSGMHMIVLRTGKVLALDFPAPMTLYTHCLLFDPVTEMVTDELEGPANFEESLICAGPVALADGRIFFNGGVPAVNLTTLFDPDVDPPGPASWIPQDLGPADRFYPTCTLLGDGTVLVTAGMIGQTGPGPNTPDIFDPTQPTGQQWRRLTEAEYCTHELDCTDPPETPAYNFHLHNYPFMYLLTSGEVAYVGSDDGDASATLDSTPGTRTLKTQLGLEAWTEIIPEAEDPIRGGSAVLYRPDKIMKAGGRVGDAESATVLPCDDPVLSCVHTIDMGVPDPTWTMRPSMANARESHIYLIVLPDGKILATNGQNLSGHVLVPELYDPDAGPPDPGWQPMAAMDDGRTHHASAVLLPDARVLVAGDPTNTAQIFSPPYLFVAGGGAATRPTMTGDCPAPNAICYGATFSVMTPDANAVTAVSLIRPGSATHGMDFEQRFMTLTSTVAASDELSVTAPATSNDAPPGHYMLFILEGDVPSEARFVSLSGGNGLDCNTNASPDDCDIAAGISADCNCNAIPDECDLTSGTSQDCDADGVPDECNPPLGVCCLQPFGTCTDEKTKAWCDHRGGLFVCDESCPYACPSQQGPVFGP